MHSGIDPCLLQISLAERLSSILFTSAQSNTNHTIHLSPISLSSYTDKENTLSPPNFVWTAADCCSSRITVARQTHPGSRDLWTRLMFTETGEKLCFHQTDQGRIFLAISKRPENKGFPLLPLIQPAHQSHSAGECSLAERVIREEPETGFYKKMPDKVCSDVNLNPSHCCLDN